MKAIIVDDSRTMRMIISRILRRLDFDITEAENGAAALEVLRRDPTYAVALVDWNMPVMDGLTFVETVRADGRLDDMKIMMVTTETEYDQVARALSAGATEYLMKPFTEDAVTAKLSLLGLGSST